MLDTVCRSFALCPPCIRQDPNRRQGDKVWRKVGCDLARASDGDMVSDFALITVLGAVSVARSRILASTVFRH